MDNPLVWIDLEMTGLDPERDVVVEIAVVVTDGQLQRVVEGPDLVVHQPDEALAGMVDVVRDMHAKSGLTEAVRASELSLADAEKQVLAFVREHVPEAGAAPLAGNSIHADRAFIRRHLPDLDAHLHYRNVDVSTLKELARRWHPEALESSPQKGGGHRALADIRESIAELQHYRRTMLRVPDQT
jgi:oligoribonuclease